MNNTLIHIDQYFNGELTQSEKKLFEERCLADPGFAREVANYILMRDQAKAQWVQQKKQDFAALEQEEGKDLGIIVPLKRKGGVVRKINSWRQLVVAAAMVGILILGIVVYLQIRKNDTSKLVKNEKEDVLKNRDTGDTTQKLTLRDSALNDKPKEVQPEEIDLPGREQLVKKNFKIDVLPQNTEGFLADASNEYKEGHFKNASREYENAINKIEELEETRSADDEEEAEERKLLLFYAHYYNGLSNFARGNTAKAIVELKKIKQSPDKFWQNKVQWYLALAYIKEGKIKEARTLLKKVADSRHSGIYKQKSLSLLDEIK